jgi:hypothetical protein
MQLVQKGDRRMVGDLPQSKWDADLGAERHICLSSVSESPYSPGIGMLQTRSFVAPTPSCHEAVAKFYNAFAATKL